MRVLQCEALKRNMFHYYFVNKIENCYNPVLYVYVLYFELDLKTIWYYIFVSGLGCVEF